MKLPKKACIPLMAFLLVALSAMSPGCGGKGEGDGSPQVSVERNAEEGEGGVVRLQGEGDDLQVEVWKFDPGEEPLETPVYPGAELVPGSALVSRTTRDGKVLITHQAEYVTRVDYQVVLRWYGEKVGAPWKSDQLEATWVAGGEEGATRSVVVSKEGAGTRIRIMELEGDLDLRPEE